MTIDNKVPNTYDIMLEEENGEAMYGFDKEKDTFSFEFSKPRECDKNKILKTVYTEMTRGKKDTFGSRLSRKAIESGKDSIAASMLDPYYNDATEEVSQLYSPVFRNFIGLYLFRDGKPFNLIGFTSIPGLVELTKDANGNVVDLFGEDKPFIINDLFVPGIDGYATEGVTNARYDMVQCIYDIILDRLEELIQHSMVGDKITIDFRTLGTNGTLWRVLDNRGYQIADSGDLENLFRFTKELKKREDVNEGNNSRK